MCIKRKEIFDNELWAKKRFAHYAIKSYIKNECA